MKFFRSRIFVVLFFCLISLGQAYPYSYAWAMGQETECGCNLAGRKCLHGCDLKHHGHHHDSGMAAQESADQDPAPTWVNPDCARQKVRLVLSFQSDPFLPQFLKFNFRPSLLQAEVFFPALIEIRSSSVESPPPKVS